MRPMKHLLLPALLALFCAPAWAARGLEEPSGLAKVVKGAKRSDVSTALSAPGVPEGCADALEQRELLGMACRAAVASALVRARPLTKTADLASRKALIADLGRASEAAAAWTPLEPPPGLARSRFDALGAIGRALMAVHDELAALPATHEQGAAVAALLAERPGPRQAACGAVQRALDSAGAAGASVEESGALLGLVTSHRCLVDEERLASKPKPVALQGNEEAKRVAETISVDGVIADYASTRAVELQRCQKHFDAAGRATDVEKARACLCGVLARWRFPPKAAGQAGTLLFQRARLALGFDAAGAPAQCGPLTPAP